MLVSNKLGDLRIMMRALRRARGRTRIFRRCFLLLLLLDAQRLGYRRRDELRDYGMLSAPLPCITGRRARKPTFLDDRMDLRLRFRFRRVARLFGNLVQVFLVAGFRGRFGLEALGLGLGRLRGRHADNGGEGCDIHGEQVRDHGFSTILQRYPFEFSTPRIRAHPI